MSGFVVSAANPKGGVGKSTSVLLMAQAIAKQGAKVAIIDQDRNKPVKEWAALGNVPQNITVIADNITEETIADEIDKARARNHIVFVDLEGTASLAMAIAMGMSNLVLIPMQPSQLDSRNGARVIKLLADTGRGTGKVTPHAILFTKTNPAIRTKGLRNIEQQLLDHGAKLFANEMHDREAFRAFLQFGGTIYDLDPKEVGGLDKAANNVHRVTEELLAILASGQAGNQTVKQEVA